MIVFIINSVIVYYKLYFPVFGYLNDFFTTKKAATSHGSCSLFGQLYTS